MIVLIFDIFIISYFILTILSATFASELIFAKLNILYISYDGMTDNLGQSQVIPYLIGLSKLGHSITILSAEKPDAFENRRNFISNLLQNNNISWSPVQYTSRPKVLSTLKDVYVLKKTAGKLHKEKKFDIVHCRSYISALVGVSMKRKYKTRFIFDMRGFWADERIEGGIWAKDSFVTKILYSYFKKKEIEYLTKADYTISLTNAGKRIIHSWDIPKQPIPVQVIPCCADLSLFSFESPLLDKAEIRTSLGISANSKVVSYLGSVGTWYMVDEMFDFFKEYLKKHDDAVFLFISSDSPQEILKIAEQKKINKNHIVVRKANREEVPQFLSISDFSIFFIKPVFSKQASSPTKMGEIMGMGIPVVCNGNVGDVEEIVKQTNCGVVINDFTEASYRDSISKIEENKFLSQEIRKGGMEFYSLEEGIKRYDEVYSSLKVIG